MKLSRILLIFFGSFLLAGCLSTGHTNNELQHIRTIDTVSDEYNYYQSLADYLRRVPGVSISGSESNLQVSIRGASSIHSAYQPLYIIDGHIVGTNYYRANSIIDVRDIKRVHVVRGSDAASYGIRGANGVILITTKK